MSAHTHAGRVIPLCRGCDREADTVIAHRERESLPYCMACANAELAHYGGREYPIEEFYTPAEDRVSAFDPYDSPEFKLYNPDEGHTRWVNADNEAAPGSSAFLGDNT